jgi:hypothetical protein
MYMQLEGMIELSMQFKQQFPKSTSMLTLNVPVDTGLCVAACAGLFLEFGDLVSVGLAGKSKALRVAQCQHSYSRGTNENHAHLLFLRAERTAGGGLTESGAVAACSVHEGVGQSPACLRQLYIPPFHVRCGTSYLARRWLMKGRGGVMVTTNDDTLIGAICDKSEDVVGFGFKDDIDGEVELSYPLC